MGLGRTRGYDANVVASPRVHDDKQAADRAHGFIIRGRDGVGVVKDRNRFGHTDTVFAKVDSGFARVIPLKAHSSSVRTRCAYVNLGLWRDAGACGAAGAALNCPAPTPPLPSPYARTSCWPLGESWPGSLRPLSAGYTCDVLSMAGKFLSHVLPAILRPLRVLWNQVIGFVFLVFAVLARG